MKQGLQQPQQAPGRITTKRQPSKKFQAIAIVFLLAIFSLLFCPLCATVTHSSEPLFYMLIVGFLLLASLPAMPVLLVQYLNDPDRKMSIEERIKVREERQRETQATSAAATAPDEVAPYRAGVLGGAYSGTLNWYVPPFAILPEPELNKHGVVVGGSGSGKTVSLLRIAYLATKIYGYRVFYLDAKGDRDTAAAFLAMMSAMGKKPRMFPRESFDGWRGDGIALLNRFMSVETFSEPYYRAATKRALTLVCNDKAGPPRNSNQFWLSGKGRGIALP